MNCFRLLLSLFVFVQLANLNAQDNPVSWQFELMYSDSGSFVVAKAEIESGWYVYSQFLESDDGPISTQLVLSDSSLNLDKPIEEGQSLYGYDEMFGMDIKKFKLEIGFDTKNFLVSILNTVPKEKMFNENYPYKSSESVTMKNAFSNKSIKSNFNVVEIMNQDFRIDIVQEKYFVIKSFNQLSNSLEDVRHELFEQKN